MLHNALARGFGIARLPELALLAVTAIWGATFLVVHFAMEHSGPLFFVGMRFLAAGFVTAAVFARALRGLTWFDVAAGTAIGGMIAVGYGLQSVGLQTIDSSASAFITAMYVPLVPLLSWLATRTRPQRQALLGIAIAFVGLIVLAAPGAHGLGLGAGETATLVGALAIAAEILLISHFAVRADLRRVTIVQLFAAGSISLIGMPVVGESIPPFSTWWVGGALGLGIASAFIQLTMNWAQRSVSSTRATVIYAGEPVWGGVFGRLAGERLSPNDLLGAVLIVSAMLVSTLTVDRRRFRRRSPARGETTIEECSRVVLNQCSRDAVSRSTSALPVHDLCRSISSDLYSPMVDSINALSSGSPTLPIDPANPDSINAPVKARDV